jgi:alpha-tubulin suppressor-like RCC1 family protein
VGAIFAGGRDAFLEKSDGTLLCWGTNDYANPAKKGEKRDLSLAVLAFEPFSGEENSTAGNDVQGEQAVIKFRAIAAGSKHSLALAEDGTVWAWGENEAGQVTDKAVGSANAPRQVADRGGRTLDEVISIAAGMNTSLAVRRDGSLWLWGQNPSLDEYISLGRSGSNGVWGGRTPQQYPAHQGRGGAGRAVCGRRLWRPAALRDPSR